MRKNQMDNSQIRIKNHKRSLFIVSDTALRFPDISELC